MAFSVASLASGLDVMLGHRKLYGLTRTRQRFRCLEVGNRLSRSLTALAVFAIAGKIGVAIDLVHLHVSFAHPLTRFPASAGTDVLARDTPNIAAIVKPARREGLLIELTPLLR